MRLEALHHQQHHPHLHDVIGHAWFGDQEPSRLHRPSWAVRPMGMCSWTSSVSSFCIETPAGPQEWPTRLDNEGPNGAQKHCLAWKSGLPNCHTASTCTKPQTPTIEGGRSRAYPWAPAGWPWRRVSPTTSGYLLLTYPGDLQWPKTQYSTFCLIFSRGMDGWWNAELLGGPSLHDDSPATETRPWSASCLDACVA